MTDSPNKVTVQWTIDEEALKKQFKGVSNVFIHRSGKSASVEFESEAAAKAATEVSNLQVAVAVKTPAVFCRPDVTQSAFDATKAITITDDRSANGGRIYKNSALPTKHVASLSFKPVLNSVILPDVDFGSVKINVLSVIVVPEKEGRMAIYVRVKHAESNRQGDLVFKRHVAEDGKVTFSRRCFDLLADKDDYKQANEANVLIRFVTVQSITIDPETGLWSELKLALDEVTAELKLFRVGGGARVGRRSGAAPRGRRTAGGAGAPRRAGGRGPRAPRAAAAAGSRAPRRPRRAPAAKAAEQQ